MDKKVNILFTATFSTSFIQEDLKILRNNFFVNEIISSGFKTLIRYISTIRSNDISFSWFASVYSSFLIFLARIFGKKSILILGGVDVAKIPELHYGIWNSWWKSRIVSYGIKHADVTIAVDGSIKNDAMRLADYHGNNIIVLPTGHDSTFWVPIQHKENFILTVANCDNYSRYKIKGIDFLYNVAAVLPDVKFVLVGMSKELQNQFTPPRNLEILEFKPKNELLDIYQRAKIYFQPSLREAFGSSICEAMLCNCYPIGTNVGGIPTVIDNIGSLIPFGDKESAMNEINKGLQIPVSHQPREYIISNFSLEKREKIIIKTISQLFHG